MRGYQPQATMDSICVRCTGSPTFYDWLYLGFMAILSVVLHWFFIDFTNKRKRSLVILHLSALTEGVLSGLLTVILVEPLGSLSIVSCPVHVIQDWYTMLYNPRPNYTSTLHCTQEIVYPLYTIVMIYYAFSLIFLMTIRPIVSIKFLESRGSRSIYAALYFLPILIVVQAVLGGLIYYSFPYITLVVSVITCAIHLVLLTYDSQSIKELIKENFTSCRNLTILIGHWLLHTYGIIALTELKNPTFHASFIALVPFPALFYILTVKFTNPDYLDSF